MEKKIHLYVQRKEFLKRAVRNPLTTTVLISSTYFVISYVGLLTSYFLFQQVFGGDVDINSHHIMADLIFLLFSTSFISGLSLFALTNLNSAYSRVEDEKRNRMDAVLSVDVDCVNYMNKQLIPRIKSELPNEITIETSGAIPVVYADKFLLSHVLNEVLINAATYVSPEIHPKVVITGQINQENTVIRISDNGIGVDPGHQDDIFNIFTRLHGIEHYPGLGLVLAIAKRGMQIMEGDIVLQSDGVSGSTIILTFAKPPKKPN